MIRAGVELRTTGYLGAAFMNCLPMFVRTTSTRFFRAAYAFLSRLS